MSREIVCSRCQNKLLVRDDVAERWLTCPRCLGSILNPLFFADRAAASSPPEPPRPSELDEPIPAPAPRRHDTCPECLAQILPRWRSCPYCSCPLSASDAEPSPRRRFVDDTNRDFNITAIVLIGLGIVGICVYIMLLSYGLVTFDTFESFFETTLAIGFVVIVMAVIGMVLGMRRRSAGEAAVAGALGGVTIGLTVAGMSLLVVVAFIYFAVVSCTKSCSSGSRKPTGPTKVQPQPQPQPQPQQPQQP